VSEKRLGTEVAVDCKSVRIKLMVSRGCDEINRLHSEGPWVYKVLMRETKTEIPDCKAPGRLRPFRRPRQVRARWAETVFLAVGLPRALEPEDRAGGFLQSEYNMGTP
jgi:hypothetical protein